MNRNRKTDKQIDLVLFLLGLLLAPNPPPHLLAQVPGGEQGKIGLPGHSLPISNDRKTLRGRPRVPPGVPRSWPGFSTLSLCKRDTQRPLRSSKLSIPEHRGDMSAWMEDAQTNFNGRKTSWHFRNSNLGPSTKLQRLRPQIRFPSCLLNIKNGQDAFDQEGQSLHLKMAQQCLLFSWNGRSQELALSSAHMCQSSEIQSGSQPSTPAARTAEIEYVEYGNLG